MQDFLTNCANVLQKYGFFVSARRRHYPAAGTGRHILWLPDRFRRGRFADDPHR